MSARSGWRCFELICRRQGFGRVGVRAEGLSPDVKYLVNAAGFGKIGPVGSIASGDETGMVRVNYEALVAVTHRCCPT